jgi:hypothetical protein
MRVLSVRDLVRNPSESKRILLEGLATCNATGSCKASTSASF